MILGLKGLMTCLCKSIFFLLVVVVFPLSDLKIFTLFIITASCNFSLFFSTV